MSAIKPRRIVAGAVLALVVGAGVRCAHGPDVRARRSSAVESPVAAESDERTAPLAPQPTAPTGLSVPPARSAEHAALALQLRQSNAADLDMLAEIERQTGASPSRAAQRLVALHEQGKSTSELLRAVDQELEPDIRVQTAARRWLRRIAGKKQTPSAASLPARTGPRHIQTLQRATPK